MLMGGDAILSFSINQKMNTGSFIEVELIDIADSLGLIICTN